MKDEQFKKDLRKEIPGLVGSLLKLYGGLFVVGWIILGMTQFMWLTEDTSWSAVFIVALILPFILAALIFAWASMKVDRCDRIVKLLVDSQTENPQIQEADAYLRKLVDQNKLKEQLYDKVREARAACFENGRVLEKKLLEYRQLLYDVDPEYAAKRKFYADPAEAAKAEKNRDDAASGTADASGKNATSTAGTTGTAAGIAAATGVVGSACVSSYDDLDDDDSIALDMEESIDDDIMFHGGNPFDCDTRSDYLDDPFGFGDDDGFGGDGDEW